MPPKEKLRDLAKHNSTMIIFLSVGMIEQLADTLKEEYREDTPVAVVYKASWEDQKIVIGLSLIHIWLHSNCSLDAMAFLR